MDERNGSNLWRRRFWTNCTGAVTEHLCGGQVGVHAIIILPAAAGYPASKFVPVGRLFPGADPHLAVECPCCDARGTSTRHERNCPQAGARVNRHLLLIHTVSRMLNCGATARTVESGAAFDGRQIFLTLLFPGGSS